MYYSSESSDSENSRDSTSLDLSYLLLDSESIGFQLQNSIIEHIRHVEEVSRKFTDLDLSGRIASHECSEKCDIDCTSKYTGAISPDSALVSQSVRVKEVQNLTSSASNDASHRDERTEKLFLQHNMIVSLPYEIIRFPNLKHLDISNNNLTSLNEFLPELIHLEMLIARNNLLDDNCLPKDFSCFTKLREVNLSGNHLTFVPPPLLALSSLKFLYLGGNQIEEVSTDINKLQSLQVLHLGGNRLTEVPKELGELPQLGVLALCDNQIRRLPRVISKLTKLRSLLLHNNNLCCLPLEIVKLRGLSELSIRDNPLVRKFVSCCAKDMLYTAPTLMELAARAIKSGKIVYGDDDLPHTLQSYLNSGQKCVNPKCKGVYFTSCVEHIKFVDFCGKYRVPLMHYLCSSRCSSKTPDYYRTSSQSESDEDGPIRRVLLG